MAIKGGFAAARDLHRQKFTGPVASRPQAAMMCVRREPERPEGRDDDQSRRMGFINLEWLWGSESIDRETTDQAGASRQLSLRCADVHPVTCDVEWTALSASELVAKAVDHGVDAHGFSPGWYTRKRIAAISRAARGTRADPPPRSRGETGNTAGQKMRDLPIDEAAAVLGVSPETLRVWEQRYGYPHSAPDAAGERRYAFGEVIALRDSLQAGLSVIAAIDRARGVGTNS
jgi:MerR HTH family regulatory protein/Protein of unknown function (DUF1059)